MLSPSIEINNLNLIIKVNETYIQTVTNEYEAFVKKYEAGEIKSFGFLETKNKFKKQAIERTEKKIQKYKERIDYLKKLA